VGELVVQFSVQLGAALVQTMTIDDAVKHTKTLNEANLHPPSTLDHVRERVVVTPTLVPRKMRELLNNGDARTPNGEYRPFPGLWTRDGT
jgi:hypothetical protein